MRTYDISLLPRTELPFLGTLQPMQSVEKEEKKKKRRGRRLTRESACFAPLWRYLEVLARNGC